MNAWESEAKTSITKTNVHVYWVALTNDIVQNKKISVFWEKSGMS